MVGFYIRLVFELDFNIGTPNEVLDGDLDGFIEASLAHRVNGGATSVVEDVE